MDPASYETHLVQTAFQYTRFFLLTYGSLQVAAIVFCKGWLRAVAVLPLIVMVPIIISGANPRSHADGSLYGLVMYVPYLPVMIYLAVILGAGIFVTKRTPKATADTQLETTGGTPTSNSLTSFVMVCVLAGIILLVLMFVPFG
jgi:hypothetical protein